MSEYIPGICNIGPEEIKNRRSIGMIWLVVSVIYLLVIFPTHLHPIFRVLVALPLIVSASGFYQAAFHFCAGFGAAGLYNVSKSVGKTDTVMQADFRKKDKTKAQQIFGLSIITGIIISVIAYFL